MLATRPIVRYASLSARGRVRLANEDAVRCASELGLFVVADGLGGLPSGEAASQVAVHALPRVLERALKHPGIPKDVSYGALVRDAMIVLSREMNARAQLLPHLQGMGATIVAVMFQARLAHIVNAGDSRAYLLRGDECRLLTHDHILAAPPASDPTGAATRRLLVQYMAMRGEIRPDAVNFTLQERDRILLCSDGLSGSLSLETIGQILASHPDPQQACRALANAANELDGTDNITAVIIDWLGYREGPPRQMPDPLPDLDTQAAHQIVEDLIKLLTALETQIAWLQQGGRETAQESYMRSLAAAKRLLGGNVYLDFILQNPSDNPFHVFHQVCTREGSAWRAQYDAHKAAIEPVISQLVTGQVRISPLLSSEESGRIARALWKDLLYVEQRFFALCLRPLTHLDDRTLEAMVEHMIASVRTIQGLIEFLPRLDIMLAGSGAPAAAPAPVSAPAAPTA